jgi:TRAP-type C4-dicarboxylate transport system substrate-binding protein
MTGLQTGMIEALPTTPLAALSLQWYSQTPYMQDIGLAPLVGATVVTKRIWGRLSAAQKKALRAGAIKMQETLAEVIPDQDARAVKEMRERGLEVVEVSDAVRAEWRTAADKFFVTKREKMEAKELLDLARKERDAFRAQAAEGGR